MNDSKTTDQSTQTINIIQNEPDYFVPPPLCINRIKDYYEWLKEEKEAREEYRKQSKINSICHKE
jgi:hypothetical protein